MHCVLPLLRPARPGRPSRWRTAALLAGLLGATLLPAPSGGTGTGDAPEAIEYRVKAGYLYNFAKFITWPAAPTPPAQGPLWIGLLDAGDAVPIIQPLLEGKQVNGRPIRIQAVKPGVLGRELHILMVTRSARRTPESIAAELGTNATLVVGETDQFATRGGMIGFVREEEAIRLTLNLDRATEAGLEVSAKLASVAKVVRTQTAR